jgi:hypothetical protein
MRPKNVILLEIMMIFISFKDADLLHYLLPNVFTQRRRVWGTIAAMERRRPPHRGLLISFFLIFPCFCVSSPKSETSQFVRPVARCPRWTV